MRARWQTGDDDDPFKDPTRQAGDSAIAGESSEPPRIRTTGRTRSPRQRAGNSQRFQCLRLARHQRLRELINGRAAVGGNANFSRYTIGDALTNSHGTRDDLIVGGNLNYQNGQVFNGNVVYGGTGTFNSFGHPNGTIRHDSVIDFASAESQLDSLSDQYAALPTNGTTQDTNGTVTLTGTNPGTNVFKVTNGQLWNAKNLVIEVPPGCPSSLMWWGPMPLN